MAGQDVVSHHTESRFVESSGTAIVPPPDSSPAVTDAEVLMATVAPVGYLAAGFFGFLASLFAVVRSKKRKAKRAVVYFAAALLVLNILTTPPAFYVASRIVQSI